MSDGGPREVRAVRVVGRKYLRSRNKERRNGTEERPEWGASLEKPSEFSESKPEDEFNLLECVRSFLLVVLRIRSDLSALM